MKASFVVILKLLCIFALLYDINFSAYPGLTTSRIGLISLFVIHLIKEKTFSKKAYGFLAFLTILIVYSMGLSLYSNDFAQTQRLIWFSLYGIVCPFILTKYIKSKNEFLWLVSIATLIQAIITIVAYVNPAVKLLVSSMIISTSNYDETNVMRAIGFASIGGASLSFIQSVGVFSILLLQRLNSYTFFTKFLLWLLLLVVLISIVFIGRTGLVVSFCAVIIYMLSLRISIPRVVGIVFFAFLIWQVDFLTIIETVTKNIEGYNSELFVLWVTESFQVKNNGTVEILNSMPIPPLSVETLIGTGRVVDISGLGNASGNDSGYIQTYYALGLIVSVLFYSGYLLFLMFRIHNTGKYALGILVLIVFMAEFKEPFIFSYSVPFYILSTFLIFNRRNERFNAIHSKEIVL